MAENYNIMSKVALLLEKTRDALIADLRQEFIGVRYAALKFEKEQSIENFIPVIDAVFSRVGYDISHYEELSEVRSIVEKLLGVTDEIAGVVKTGSKMSDDGEFTADEIAKLCTDLIPLIKEVVELVRLVSDVEWEAVAADLDRSNKDIALFVKNELLTKDFARKVLDHILVTLLKNAKVVFKDEIEFAKFTIEFGVQQLIDNANELGNVLEKNVFDVVDAKVELIQNTMKETLTDATDLYNRVRKQVESQAKKDVQTLAKEYKSTYIKIADGLSITYSILEFLGIVEQKNVTLQLPYGLKEAVDKVQGAVDNVSGKINASIDKASPLVAETTSTVVSTMNDVLKTTRDVTGMGVAAAGTIDLQLAMVNDFMMDATTDIATGLASIEAGVKSTIKDVNNFKNNANTVVSKFNDEVKRIKDWRYPISITVISWEKVADLFTNPVDHFKALYPIESMADVESLMTRIMDILHNINSDIPDFSSLRKLLEDLLRKLQKHVIKKINELKAQMKEVASEVKKKIQKVINDIWNWFQPVVTTIRNVITMLKELAIALKDEMEAVLDEVKEGARLIADDLQNEFKTIKGKLENVGEAVEDSVNNASATVKAEVDSMVTAAKKNIETIHKKADAFQKEVEKQVKDTIKEAEDTMNGISKDAEKKAKERIEAAQDLWKDLKKDMPKMPKLDLPKVVKTTLAEPMADCVKKTLNEALDFDLSSVIDFGQQRDELVACIEALKADYERFKAGNFKSVSLNISEKDFTAVYNINFNTNWKTAMQLPDIPKLVQQVVVPDLQAWAYGMVNSVQTLVSPTVWQYRLNTVVTQLKAEFQNDLNNITGLISKNGALCLISDPTSVGDRLAANLNITDYISIVETAVHDVVLPDPEYYYTSFKQCVFGIITKLTARILEEVQRMKSSIKSAVNELKQLPSTVKTNVETLLGKLEAAEKKLADELSAKQDKAKNEAFQLVADIRSTATTIKHIVEKIPETIDNLVDFFENKAEATLNRLKNNTKEALEQIAKNFLNRLEDLATEIWRRFKNEYIISMLKAIKNQIIHFIKHVIKKKLQELIDAFTDLKSESQNGINSLLKDKSFFKKLHEEQVTFANQVNSALKSSASSGSSNSTTNNKIKKALPEGKLTNLNQLPALIDAVKDDEKLSKSIFEKAKFNIQTEDGAPDINVPYYYITWVQNVLGSTVNFVQSDMGLKEILKLVQALYNGIPAEVKQHVSEVMPSLPSLPSNGFTDLLNDVTCSYDLDNMMCNVTLLDLKPKEDSKHSGTLDWDASLKLQLFIMAGLYSKDGFVEKKDDEESDSKDDKKENKKENDKKDNSKNTTSDETDAEDNAVPAIFFTMMLQGKVILTFKLGDNHHITLNGDGKVGAEKLTEQTKDLSVGFCLSKKDNEKGVTSRVHGFGSTKSLSALLMGEFSRNEGTASLAMIESKYMDVKMGNYPIGAYVLYNHAYPKFQFNEKEGSGTDMATFLGSEQGTVDGFTAGVFVAVKDFEMVLKLRQNDFFATFLKDDISAKFDLPVAYDYLKGFKMDGGYTFHLDIDCDNKEIGSLKLNSLGIDLGSVKDDLGTLQLQAVPSFSIQLGDSVTMSFDKLGVGMDLNVAKVNSSGNYSIGDFDPDFSFKFPEGIGVAIDCSVVKGSALIGYDDVKKELFGAMELTIIEKFGVSALLMMTFGDNFSMVAMLSARFSPGIPLGLGFSLTAVGGMLGLHRMLDYDAIRQAVHSGTLESVFFVEDVMKHIGDMRKAAEKIFPAKRDQFFVGLLGQISYEPVVRCSFGLMFQMPDPLSVIIVGTSTVAIQGTDIIRINVAFSGEIDFKKGLQFDASLYDSQIVGLRLEGDMAFRLFWGGPVKGFLMSIGGFHPAYRPEEAMHVSDMRRLSMKLDYSLLKVGLETYLAITSNTFQIGARLDITVGWKQFGLTGYAGFDALFQFDPFMFMFDIEAGMAVMIGKARILSVDLALSLSGPRPWHAKGKAEFSFLFIPVKVKFDISWGGKQQQLPSKQIEVLPLLVEQINDHNNWMIAEGRRFDKEVNLIAGEEEKSKDGNQMKPMLLTPNGELSFSQSAIPMELEMELCNNAVPTDYNEIVLDQVVLNNKPYEIINVSAKYNENNDNDKMKNAIGQTTDTDFAPALFTLMDEDEKLKSPSYVKYPCGFVMKSCHDRTVGNTLECDLGGYEIFVRGRQITKQANRNINIATASEGKGVAYQKNDKAAFERYVSILDTIQ